MLHCNSTFCSIAWSNLFQQKSYLLEKYNCQLLVKQFEFFKSNTTPTIADSRIKSIPIVENGEDIIDIKVENHPRIFMLSNPKQPFALPECNSGFICASKMRVTVFEKLKRMLNYLDLLASEFGYTAGTVHIAIFEALRDIKIQEVLFNQKREEIKLAHPQFTDAQLDAETSKWVSPVKNNIPVHSTGAAVDMRLLCEGAFIDMGKFGVIWGANPTAPTFSEECTEEQKNNRLYMLMAATMAGLVNYSYEFWHFSAGDRYYCYWQELPTEKIACYSSVL